MVSNIVVFFLGWAEKVVSAVGLGGHTGVLVGVLAILFTGFVAGKFVSLVLDRVFYYSGFSVMVSRTRLDKSLEELGLGNLCGAIIFLVRWDIYVFALSAALEYAGLGTVSPLLVGLVSVLGRAIVALIVFVLGVLLTEFLSRVVRESSAAIEKHYAGVGGFVEKFSLLAGYLFFGALALDVVGFNPLSFVVLFAAFLFLAGFWVVIGTRDLASSLAAGILLKTLGISRDSWIKSGGVTGRVIEVGPFVTTVKKRNTVLHVYNKNLLENGVETKEQRE